MGENALKPMNTALAHHRSNVLVLWLGHETLEMGDWLSYHFSEESVVMKTLNLTNLMLLRYIFKLLLLGFCLGIRNSVAEFRVTV